MDTAALTVFFESPFWVGLYERTEGGQYSVCRIVFGAEPRDQEVYDFLLRNWDRLRFTPAMDAQAFGDRPVGHKRMQRQIKEQLRHAAPGTRAQQALKLQQEQGKLSRKARSRQEREAQAQRKRALHLQKRREKHRGH